LVKQQTFAWQYIDCHTVEPCSQFMSENRFAIQDHRPLELKIESVAYSHSYDGSVTEEIAFNHGFGYHQKPTEPGEPPDEINVI
jgi:hypothetical protein